MKIRLLAGKELTMSNNLVGDVSGELLDTWADILVKMRAGRITLDHLKKFGQMDPTPFAVTAKSAKREIERFAAKTARRLSGVFKKRILVDPVPLEFTDENLAHWATFNMRPVFLPGEEIGKDRPLKGWVKKPRDWFYDNVANGDIKPIHDLKPTQLRRGWYLADFTVGADYTNGNQVFVDDPLAKIITDLREKKVVGKHENTSMGSRFSITWDEWQDVVLAHIASKLNVTRAQTRLERAIEFNAIGNLYDANLGKFNSYEWFQDHFEDSYRLCGGFRVYGGLADIYYDWPDGRGYSVAGRPLVSFVQ